MLVEPLIGNCHESSFILFYFRNNIKNHEYILFNVSIFVSIVHFSFHSLFSFLFIFWNIEEPLTYTREHTSKASIASRLCGFDPFSLYAITEVSRNQSTHTLISDFKMTLFVHGFLPFKFWLHRRVWKRFDLTFLLTFFLYFWCTG